jgi:hypothetical protein
MKALRRSIRLCMMLMAIGIIAPLAAAGASDERNTDEPHVGGYIGGFGGYRFSGSLTDVEAEGIGLRGTASDVKYDGSFLGGVKLGGWFNRYFGLQAEGWYSRVKTPAQNVTVNVSGFGSATVPTESDAADTYTGAVNLMLRVPARPIEPYVGVGVAVMHWRDADVKETTDPGLNLLAGIQGHLGHNVMAFAEFKYTRLEMSPTVDGVTTTVTYQPIAVVAGLTLQFGGR